MATVRITINGVICDLHGRTITGPVKIVGEAMYTDLGVGGGPVYPPEGGESPPGIWPGPGPLPHPEHPIAPGGEPPRPAHPIVLPPDRPTDPPVEPPTSPANPQWQWVWNRSEGWHPAYVPGPGDAQPH